MITPVYYISLIILCATLVLGCANYNYSTIKETEKVSIENLLDYFKNVRDFSKEELYSEYDRTRHDYLNNKSNLNALRFSLVLVILNLDFEKKYQSIDILEDLIQKNKDGPIRNFSLLLRDALKETRKQKILYEIASQKLNSSIQEKKRKTMIQSETVKKLKSVIRQKREQFIQYQDISKKLHEQEKLVERLQKKIEELKAIERSINERKSTKTPTT